MLQLKNIVKDYQAGDNTVRALKGIDINFRNSEFVAILGPSGCGKTTLLNIIGGLDRYSEGDLIIQGKSTKDFTDGDWDTYRNHKVGFVFQSYNLIPHLNVLENVELALSLSGVVKEERVSRAKKALEKVGLSNQLYQKPNQLSGGQMQRVAIARAIVNDPEIILADEPTGALDSKNSLQIMELLKEISGERLIIMVTHNDELAKTYSSRIIKLKDGEKVKDSMPLSESEIAELEKNDKKQREEEKLALSTPEGKAKINRQKKKSSMGFFTAFKLSLKNLLSKKGRTFMTSFAGSIGIIGIALILALSNGVSAYIDRVQTELLGTYPISVVSSGLDKNAVMNTMQSGETFVVDGVQAPSFPNSQNITAYKPTMNMNKFIVHNTITQEYVDYVNKLDKNLISDTFYTYGININLMTKNSDGEFKLIKTKSDSVMGMNGVGVYFNQLYSSDYMLKTYDLIAGDYPKQENPEEIVLIVDKYNRLSINLLESIGIKAQDKQNLTLADFQNQEYAISYNDDFYNAPTENKIIFTPSEPTQELFDKGYKLKVVGILRIKQESNLSLMNNGLGFQTSLVDHLYENAKTSVIAAAQKENTTHNVLTGERFAPPSFNNFAGSVSENTYENALKMTGGSSLPTSIAILPKTFTEKDEIKTYLDEYNIGRNDQDKIVYFDDAASIADMLKNLVNTLSIILACFSVVSLIVSGIMIGIITYVSVIERRKEIGVLRSIGARKRDIAGVFNAETIIIGLSAGIIGLFTTFILCFPINALIRHFVGAYVGNIAILNGWHVISLLLGSAGLTLLSGLIPASIASKKDPVLALRSE